MNATITTPITSFFSTAVPAVRYTGRVSVLRVTREGKGGHLTLSYRGRQTWDVVSWEGVVGRVGFCHSTDSWIVQVSGSLDFSAANGVRHPGWIAGEYSSFDEMIGEAGLYWLS